MKNTKSLIVSEYMVGVEVNIAMAYDVVLFS